MSQLYRLALSIHVLAGITGLAAFWTPALARKGGATHVRIGRIFYNATSIVALTGLAMAAMIALAFTVRQPVFAALSPIGLLIGRGNLRYARRPAASHMSWWYEHMRSMLAGGIAFHTAFLVIGAGRFLGTYFTGPYALIPWVLPSMIGIPATQIWIGYYRTRFEGEAIRGSRLAVR